MNKIIDMAIYCKTVQKLPLSDRYNQGCKSCNYQRLCKSFAEQPSEIDTDILNSIMRVRNENNAEKEIQSLKDLDLKRDSEVIKSLEELTTRFEMSDRKLIRIKQVILSNAYTLKSEKLNAIARIVGE